MSQRSNCFKVLPDQEPGPCCNCDQEDISKRYVHLIHKKSENPGFYCTNDLFLQYLKHELNFESELNISEKNYCCSYCYNSFNLFCRSEAGEEAKFQTPQYLSERLNKLTCIDPVDICADNIDTVTLHHVIEFVVKSFLDDKPLLLPVVYEKYMNLLKTNINTFKCTISSNEQLKLLNHNLKWLLRMLKVKLGKALLHFVPKRKKDGSLIYRNGADLLSSLHTMTVYYSFDNLDKNQSYSVVGSEKDKSGFHGTTIQTATPCPSLPTTSTVDFSVNIDSFSDDMDTEKSSFTSIAVLDETADKKETVLQVLNILHEKFQIGSQCDYAVVVGDGEHGYSVALDEAHEMEINLKTKNALNSFSQSSLAALTYYLPYRAETIYNLKTKLFLENEMPHQTQHTTPYVELEKKNIHEYFCHLKQSYLFCTGDRLTLHHIFTDTDATAEQTDSLMKYRQLGQEDLSNYVNCFLLKTTDSKTKPPPRKKKKINLKTFSISKVTVHRQKKERKDQKTVISCLRKKIAFSKLTNKPVSNLEQFIQLPRAICDAEGVPEKGQKSWATTVFKKLYSESFLTNLPVFISAAKSLAFIIDAINGVSPKDLERSRRDSEIQSSDYEEICPNTVLPQNWRSFIGVRFQKRLLVNFLSDKFLQLANEKFSSSDFLLVTAGGFDNEFKDKALCSKHGSITEYFDAAGDHEEADTRVWLHAVTSSAINIIIYSPDTDVYFIGLPILKNINKSIFVQLKDTPYEKSFIDMNALVRSLKMMFAFRELKT
ncbi:unnamed protein product [Mytilus edulis]|uniref:Uncharacterized protein n=1 Tax=Mytilus edulis TaxID=6550 RepID=A0A8S3S019_MYTED|nr:unnamed protein product [Mytilus edulis]